MMCIPVLGLIVGLIIYFYMKHIYRKVVQEINKDNYMSYNDLQEFNQHFATGQFTNFPNYIDNVIAHPEEAKLSAVNFHE